MAKLRAVGRVIHYWTRLGVAGVELIDSLRIDNRVHFLGTSTDLKQRVTSMQLDHRFIEEAHAGQQVGILVADRVRAGDTVYLVED